MLHYLNAGLRNYGNSPVYSYARGVVEFQVICRGSARPEPCPLSVKAPCLWVFSPTFVHGWVDDPGKESEIRVFHFSRVDPMVQQLLSREGFLACGLSRRDLARVEEGYRRLADPGTVWRELVSDLVAAELSLLAVKDWPRERERSGNQVAERAVRQACSWYLEHLSEGPDVNDLAKVLGLSPAHVRRHFHTVYQRGPREVLHELRMQMGRDWLRAEEASVQEISDRLGFSEPSAFSRACKRFYGAGPSKLRELKKS